MKKIKRARKYFMVLSFLMREIILFRVLIFSITEMKMDEILHTHITY